MTNQTLPPLLLCCPEAFGAGDLVTLLCTDPRIAEAVPPEAVPARLAADPQAGLLMLYEAPARFVAARLAQDMPPTEAVAQWQQAVAPLLTLLRGNRARTHLMQVAMVRSYPEVFAGKLGAAPGTVRALTEAAAAPPPPLLAAIAEQACAQDPALRRAATELSASLLDLSNGAPAALVDPDTAYRALAALHDDLAEATALYEDQQQSFAGEREMLRQLVQDVQADLETRYAQLQDTRAALQAQKEKVLELSVHGDVVMAEKDRVTEKLAYTEALLDGIMQSRSYRIMAPLRRLRGLVQRRR